MSKASTLHRRVLLPHDVAGLRPATGSVVRALAGQIMGTTWSVKVLAPASVVMPGDAIGRVLDNVVAQMSHWEASSNLSRFNQAPAQSWHVLPDAFFKVLAYGLDVARISNGAYDPAAGALVNAWGFGPVNRYDEAGFVSPSASAIQAMMDADRPTWRDVALDASTQRAWQPGGLLLDLSSIAKGYAVDALSDYLLTLGFDHHLVEVGGELKGVGMKPDEQPWWVELEQPAEDGDLPLAPLLALHGLAVATSGDYRRFYEQDGMRQAHTIDPRAGMPVRHGLASVTVIHAQGMAADAWSTALMVLGPDVGMALARQQGLAARFVCRQGGGWAESVSPAFAEMLQ